MQQQEFETLKDKLTTTPMLNFPSYKKPFHIPIDASGMDIGAVLVQPGEGNVDHPICFSHTNLTPREQNYTTKKYEELSMIYVLNKF